jgi:phosphatidylglycerol lysyltransferase
MNAETMMSRWPADVRRARDLVLSFGWNATSYQIVNPGIRHWFAHAGDAVVGYVTYAGIRVVAGAPVCTERRLAEVVDEFEASSKERAEGVCYFGAEARLGRILKDSPGHSRALLGAQPAWNPNHWDNVVKSHASLRAQLNRASNKSVTIVEYTPAEAMRAADLQHVLAKWLAGRGLPPLHFLVEPDTLDRLVDRRIFVARHGEAAADEPIAAFAVLSPIPARNGWLVEQFPRVPTAPNGTIELLLTSAVRAVAASGASYVTLGLAPLARRIEFPHWTEPLWLRAALRMAELHGRRFYNFGGLEAFKAKFRPEEWEPVYAIEAAPQFSPRALYAIAGAFASRSPLRLMPSALFRAVRQEIAWLRR